jgi:hypothetical protein
VGAYYHSLLMPDSETLIHKTRRSDRGTRFRTSNSFSSSSFSAGFERKASGDRFACSNCGKTAENDDDDGDERIWGGS